MYHGGSIHGLINNIRSLREMKAHSCPAKALREMLRRRHLAPSHGSVIYINQTGIASNVKLPYNCIDDYQVLDEYIVRNRWAKERVLGFTYSAREELKDRYGRLTRVRSGYEIDPRTGFMSELDPLYTTYVI